MTKKDLIIVESPSKIKKVTSYAGSNYIVMASVGHFMELSSVDKNFDPKYKVMKDKKKVIDDIRKQCKKVGTIYLATDPDREGEAIAWHLYDQVKAINPNIKRITFNEITKKAISAALAAPRDLDDDLINAAKSRQILDRLVGFKVSPLVWKSVAKARSAGRVQSPALRLVIERQREIDAFIPVKYWTIDADLKNSTNEDFVAQLSTKKRLEDHKKVLEILSDVKGADFIVDLIEKKQIKKSPSPPFDTSTLQQTASNIFNWSPKKTAAVSQALYQAGHITYIRTDSFAISADALKMVRDHIGTTFSKGYLPTSANVYKKKSKAVKEQGAHECIRPTSMSKVSLSEADQKKLYELIYDRFLASQLAPAQVDQTTYHIKADKHLFKASGQIVSFDGYLSVWSKYSKTTDKILPVVIKGEKLKCEKVTDKEHETKPPPPYSQATLIKKLEEEGIGRPSTYPSIIDLISSPDRNYVTFQKKVFAPTEIGNQLIDFLVKRFKDNFIELKYTALLEDKLDKIANGDIDWKEVLKSAQDDLLSIIVEVKKEVEEDAKTSTICPGCKKGTLVRRNGRFGVFYSCSEWKNKKEGCQYKAKLEDEEFVEIEGPKKSSFKCPEAKCKGYLVERKVGDNIYLGCENFPKCKSGLFDLDGKKIEFKKKRKKK